MVVARFESRKSDEVHEVSQTDEDLSCTCRGFQFRSTCAHVDAVQRWREWGMTAPAHVVLPPPAQWVEVRQTEDPLQ